ncbi:MAG: TatD family hydrolase [Gallionellaceae bacterium]|jgi:TatD DNase family protein
MIIDTHCHLDAAEFGSMQTALVRSAQEADVSCIVVPSVTCASFDKVRALCAQHSQCAPAYGIHPMYVDEASSADLTLLHEFLTQHRPVAIGEIGLDFFIQHYDRARQEHFFIEQLKLAREFDLPVLLHIRRAQDIVLKHLRQHKVRGGIAHAFNGSRQQADEFIGLGFKLGFGGAMTYARATKLRELAATLPLESIVLETDAPDMQPEFLERGLPNEPQYLPRIAQTLAELRGVSLEEVARVTTANALSVLPALRRSGFIPTSLVI